MAVYQRPLRPDELMHWQWEKKNHKYLDKVRLPSGAWRYIYDLGSEKSYQTARSNNNAAKRKSESAQYREDKAKRHYLADFDQSHADKNYNAYKSAYDRAQETQKEYKKAKREYRVQSAAHKVRSMVSRKPSASHANSGKKKFESLFNRLKNRKPRRSNITVTHQTYTGSGISRR